MREDVAYTASNAHQGKSERPKYRPPYSRDDRESPRMRPADRPEWSKEQEMETTIFVGNILPETTERDILKIFSQFGMDFATDFSTQRANKIDFRAYHQRCHQEK